MKKVILTFALLAISLGVNAEFTDVKWNETYKDAIHYLQDNQIVKGYQDGSFGPLRNISRSEMLKILVESKFLDDDQAKQAIESFQNKNCFQDVQSSDWFAKYVCWAKEQGWVKGYEDGKYFRPFQDVTLVEGLKMSLVSGDIQYAQTERWYKGVVDAASQINVIPHNVSYFHDKLKRNQMADLIMRIVQHKQGNLADYLGDRSQYVASWDTLKLKENLINQVSNQCKTPHFNRMISQSLFEFYNPDQSCLSVSSIYNNSLDQLPENFEHTKYKKMDYFTVFYKTNIQDQEIVDQLLASINYYTEDQVTTFEAKASSSQYRSMLGNYYVNFPSGFSSFNVREYPVQEEVNDKDLPFEDQVNRWRLEAEDRFDLESCRNYNFPSFMMFKIKTFYEYCQELEGSSDQ